MKWSFVEKEEQDENWAIQIKEGKFQGVVFSYDGMKLDHENESINFDYEVLDYHGFEDPTGDPEFNAIAGDILKAVLDDAFTRGDYVLGDKDVH